MAFEALRERWITHRNAVIGSPKFQRWVARIPLIRRVARKRAAGMFDLIAGFSYSKILLASVESGLIDLLASGAKEMPEIARATGLSVEATERLVVAAAALELLEKVSPGRWMLGEQGAALHSNPGAKAMIRHHRLLYCDLEDPLELLRKDRQEPTQLSRYWSYAGALHGHSERGEQTLEYSRLMATSQHLVAEQVLDAFSFGNCDKILDVGGGHGTFLHTIAKAYPNTALGLFDLPEVAQAGAERLAEEFGNNRIEAHGGNFFTDPIPPGYDIITLSRILHDHDDTPAMQLLSNVFRSLEPGRRLLIAEPMAGMRGAKAMGGAFFGLYLWAMGSGRPRTPTEIRSMLADAGFARSRLIPTSQPVVASIIVATA